MEEIHSNEWNSKWSKCRYFLIMAIFFLVCAQIMHLVLLQKGKDAYYCNGMSTSSELIHSYGWPSIWFRRCSNSSVVDSSRLSLNTSKTILGLNDTWNDTWNDTLSDTRPQEKSSIFWNKSWFMWIMIVVQSLYTVVLFVMLLGVLKLRFGLILNGAIMMLLKLFAYFYGLYFGPHQAEETSIKLVAMSGVYSSGAITVNLSFSELLLEVVVFASASLLAVRIALASRKKAKESTQPRPRTNYSSRYYY